MSWPTITKRSKDMAADLKTKWWPRKLKVKIQCSEQIYLTPENLNQVEYISARWHLNKIYLFLKNGSHVYFLAKWNYGTGPTTWI